MIRASVVVPTYRRADMLDRCLGALTGQHMDPTSYEIIVADDAASDKTREQVDQWDVRAGDLGHTIRYVPVEGIHGPAAARNAGWRASQAEIIAFTDDDCVPDPCWLAAGLAAFEDGVAGVMGRIEMPLPDIPTDYELNAKGLEGGEFLTANCFYRRDVLEEVGGFDTDFEVAWREDTDLWFTLLERGYKLRRAPGALVVHPIRPAEWGVSMKQQRKAMYNALLFKKHPQKYIERVAPSPNWRYYRITGALGAALLGILSGRRGLALFGTAAWALLTARFCADRLRRTSRAPSHVSEMVVTSAALPPMSIYWRVRGAIKYRVFFL